MPGCYFVRCEQQPYFRSFSISRLLSEIDIFRSNYDGIVKANHSERQFIKMMHTGRPGMILIDFVSNKNYLPAKWMGMNFPIGTFSFKLALNNNFPVAIIWLSKIRGIGYKLNVREVFFSSIEEGVSEYIGLLDQIVHDDP